LLFSVLPATFASVSARTFLYIDGFNLYNRALKDTPYKWLNPKLLAEQILEPHNTIECIKYFTARVSGQRDPTSPGRQQAYLHALASLGIVKVHFGNFLSAPITRPLVTRVRGLPKFVTVHNTQEKGSDVKLAVHLLNDAWKGVYDVAVVISNDSDLEEPMRIVKEELRKPVGLLCPHDGHPTPKLKAAATFVRHIREPHLRASQFPDPVVHDGRTIQKPAKWT
jgi:uncharacterized LabA/DUF88 family protein